MTKEEAFRLETDAKVIEFSHVLVTSEYSMSKEGDNDRLKQVHLCFITEDGSAFKFPIGTGSGNLILDALSRVIENRPYCHDYKYGNQF